MRRPQACLAELWRLRARAAELWRRGSRSTVLRRLHLRLAELGRNLAQVDRDKATGLLEFELLELENIFALLVLGSFIGLPAPPVHLTLQLLPHMERELQLMLERVSVAHDGLAEVVSVLGEP